MLASSDGDEKKGKQFEKQALRCASWEMVKVVCVQGCA